MKSAAKVTHAMGPAFRERARRCAERCCDLVEGFSWDGPNADERRQRLIDNLQGEIAGAMSQTMDQTAAPDLLRALKVMTDATEMLGSPALRKARDLAFRVIAKAEGGAA